MYFKFQINVFSNITVTCKNTGTCPHIPHIIRITLYYYNIPLNQTLEDNIAPFIKFV